MHRAVWVGTAVLFLFGLGWDLLLDWFGSRTVISGFMPALEAFFPIVGISILGGVLIYVCVTTGDYFRRWAVSRNDALDVDFRKLMESARTVGEMPALMATKTPIDLPTMYRYFLLQEKYRRWFPESMKVGEVINKAARYSEILRLHGYLKGRYKIARIERQESRVKSK